MRRKNQFCGKILRNLRRSPRTSLNQPEPFPLRISPLKHKREWSFPLKTKGLFCKRRFCKTIKEFVLASPLELFFCSSAPWTRRGTHWRRGRSAPLAAAVLTSKPRPPFLPALPSSGRMHEAKAPPPSLAVPAPTHGRARHPTRARPQIYDRSGWQRVTRKIRIDETVPRARLDATAAWVASSRSGTLPQAAHHHRQRKPARLCRSAVGWCVPTTRARCNCCVSPWSAPPLRTV